MLRRLAVGGAFVLACHAAANPAALTAGQDRGPELMDKAQKAMFYPGDTYFTQVNMKIVQGTTERVRDFVVLRRNLNQQGDQNYYLYFRQPVDVKGTALLVLKYNTKDDERTIFLPSLNLVRRVAANDSNGSFVGSNFTYEDVSGRNVTFDTHTLLREEADAYVVKSTPIKGNPPYASRTTWIDKKTMLPMREERHDKNNNLTLVQTLADIRTIDGHPTPGRRRAEARAGVFTEVTYAGTDYKRTFSNDIFSERSLRQPPAIVLK